jgi:hypothetical protein
MAAIAIALGVLVVLVLVGSRVLPQLPLGHASPASRVGGGPAVAAFPCSLPVILQQTVVGNGFNGPTSSTTTTAGFVAIPDGGFLVDSRASVAGLPGETSPVLYSPALDRWLPARAAATSPDGTRYAYVVLLPAGATYQTFTSAALHVYDVRAHRDRVLWTYPGSIDVLGWDAAGLVADTVPPSGGVRLLWRVDPSTGKATSASRDEDPTAGPIGLSGPVGFIGHAPDGPSVFRLGSRDPGTAYSVIAVDQGTRTTIYTGRAGDSTDFDPTGVYQDGNGLWFANADATRVWLWSPTSGLHNFPVSGMPLTPAGNPRYSLSLSVAGPCTKNSFGGASARPLSPAPTATPTATPAQVSFTSLLDRPLSLPRVGANEACPVSPQVRIAPVTDGGKWPNYGFGDGPVYLSGQISWYSAGSQALLLLTDPRYSGPVLVRGGRLDGEGSLGLTGPGTTLAQGAIGIPETSRPPLWGTWLGTVTPAKPGCYGLQLDGDGFTEIVVFSVIQGPPPGG